MADNAESNKPYDREYRYEPRHPVVKRELLLRTILIVLGTVAALVGTTLYLIGQ